jgi:lysozyme family protein
MRCNFDICLTELLKHEGGYVNHPSDPGGRTNLGVTQKVYEAWVGYPVTERIMRNLTPAHVRTLYLTKYWDRVKGDELPGGLDLSVFDFAVNAGPNRAKRYLQMLVGTKPDGIIGSKTMQALKDKVSAIGIKELIRGYADLRHKYYRKLRHFSTFGRGWTRRVNEVEQAALRMARE